MYVRIKYCVSSVCVCVPSNDDGESMYKIHFVFQSYVMALFKTNSFGFREKKEEVNFTSSISIRESVFLLLSTNRGLNIYIYISDWTG
jgi:hypothetical protein